VAGVPRRNPILAAIAATSPDQRETRLEHRLKWFLLAADNGRRLPMSGCPHVSKEESQMSNFDNEGMEYAELMARRRDAERTWQMCWTASGLVAGVLLSWAIAARSAGLMLPVVFAAAYGFYVMNHARRQTALIGGYVEEFFEGRSTGLQWFSRVNRTRSIPGFNPMSRWFFTFVTDAVVALAVVFAWMFAPTAPRGELMAGIVTACGVLFVFHSLFETGQLLQIDFAVFWRQAEGGPIVVKRSNRAASR
jgi:hypothetical protein